MSTPDLSGQRFTALLVVSRGETTADKRAVWVCLCDCGATVNRRGRDLRSGESTSCGCLKAARNRIQAAQLVTHGQSNSRTYRAWQNMKDRCSNPNNDQSADYGGRGITFDPAWNEFGAFLRDMGECPGDLTIERKNVNGNYCKDNCCWVSKAMQNRNTRKTVLLTAPDGRCMILSDWSKELAIPIATLHRWLKKKSFVEIYDEHH